MRAWNFGIVIPLATLVSSMILGGALHEAGDKMVAWLGAAAGVIYLATSVFLVRSFREERGTNEI